MYSIFRGCSSLKYIDLSNFNTSSITTMYSMFDRCSSLESLDLTNFNTSSVASMGSMFYGCSSLQYIDLSNFNTSSVVYMNYIFAECYSLKSLNLSSFNTSSVKDMSYMFYGCNSLQYIDLSNFDMVNCNSFASMFSFINNIKFINLYNFSNDKIISQIFNNSKGLYVCQKNKIITKPNIYNCCDYNFETNECYSNNNNTNSSNKSSFETILSIILGIIFFTGIVLLIIYFYKKKKKDSSLLRPDESSLDAKMPILKKSEISTTYEYEPQKMIKDDSDILIIFQKTKSSIVKILINPDKTMQELIKIYFKMINRPDLFGNNSIKFLKNNECIQHDSYELIKTYFNGINGENIIIVDDVDGLIDSSLSVN